ncbi:hypothetical protein ACIQWN_14240 [Streptomyces vinaceus]|uniref:hypothetical protein n=1 Tax=Streptomyces vinaceus TaxID=1960 RepID=UPI00380331CD
MPSASSSAQARAYGSSAATRAPDNPRFNGARRRLWAPPSLDTTVGRGPKPRGRTPRAASVSGMSGSRALAEEKSSARSSTSRTSRSRATSHASNSGTYSSPSARRARA